MKVFFDTEFAGPNSNPRLLSIGLVAESGQELYFEFSDGWTEDKCSPWVRVNVLPMLGSGDRLSRREGVDRILSWLSSIGPSPKLVGDSDWDTKLLDQLMKESRVGPDRYQLELLTFENKEQAKLFELAKKRYFANEAIRPHHALNDARAFRKA
jgi:hypothetical protein